MILTTPIIIPDLPLSYMMLRDVTDLPKESKRLNCDLNPGLCDFRMVRFLPDQERQQEQRRWGRDGFPGGRGGRIVLLLRDEVRLIPWFLNFSRSLAA